MQTNCNLQIIEISKCSFTDAKAKSLANGIYKSDSIKELIIRDAKISGEQLQIICDALCANETIQELRLDGVNLLSNLMGMIGEVIS